MNELLQKHGCSNVFTVPDGLRELMGDISREVLREQPKRICEFIQNYLSVLLVTREHGILAVKILEDLCDCKPSVAEHLIQMGMKRDEAEPLAAIIKEEVENVHLVEGKEKVKELEIIKKILKRRPDLDEEMTAKVCQIARNAYRDYWYRKKLLEKNLKVQPDEPWEIAAQHTLEIYKKTKPSFSELNRATQRIQAAYRGYYVRKRMLRHLKPKKKQEPKVDLAGPVIDVAESRDVDLGPILTVQTKGVDNVEKMFAKEEANRLGLSYDPMLTITTNITNYNVVEEPQMLDSHQRMQSKMMSTKSLLGSRAPSQKMVQDPGSKVAHHHGQPIPIPDGDPFTKISFGEIQDTKIEVIKPVKGDTISIATAIVELTKPESVKLESPEVVKENTMPELAKEVMEVALTDAKTVLDSAKDESQSVKYEKDGAESKKESAKDVINRAEDAKESAKDETNSAKDEKKSVKVDTDDSKIQIVIEKSGTESVTDEQSPTSEAVVSGKDAEVHYLQFGTPTPFTQALEPTSTKRLKEQEQLEVTMSLQEEIMKGAGDDESIISSVSSVPTSRRSTVQSSDGEDIEDIAFFSGEEDQEYM